MGKERILQSLVFVLRGPLALIVRGELCISSSYWRVFIPSPFVPVQSREVSTWSHPSALWASPRAACYYFWNLLLIAGPADMGPVPSNMFSLLCALFWGSTCWHRGCGKFSCFHPHGQNCLWLRLFASAMFCGYVIASSCNPTCCGTQGV